MKQVRNTHTHTHKHTHTHTHTHTHLACHLSTARRRQLARFHHADLQDEPPIVAPDRYLRRSELVRGTHRIVVGGRHFPGRVVAGELRQRKRDQQSAHRHTGTQTHDTQAHRHTDTRHTDTQAHRHTGTQAHKQTAQSSNAEKRPPVTRRLFRHLYLVPRQRPQQYAVCPRRAAVFELRKPPRLRHRRSVDR
eukprot:SAG31_NODE_10571_length_1123_cov_0.953125_2_plen_192_part_00